MSYCVALPRGGGRDSLDVVDPNSTAIQRFLRRHGLAGYEPATMAAILAQLEAAGPGFRFVDVGANIGLYSLLAAAMFEPEEVIAFEPTPDIATVARQLVAANGLSIDLQEAAISDRAGTAALHLANLTDVSNSLVEGFKASDESVDIPTLRLDDVASTWDRRPTIVKIDVEGHEAAALAGGRATIERLRPTLFVEVLNRKAGRLAQEIAERVDGLGYSCYRLDDVPEWTPVERVEVTPEGHRDWMLTPAPLGDDFPARWQSWRDRLAECTPDRNSRVPVIRTSIAAFRRGGTSEVIASLRRFINPPTPD